MQPTVRRLLFSRVAILFSQIFSHAIEHRRLGRVSTKKIHRKIFVKICKHPNCVGNSLLFSCFGWNALQFLIVALLRKEIQTQTLSFWYFWFAECPPMLMAAPLRMRHSAVCMCQRRQRSVTSCMFWIHLSAHFSVRFRIFWPFLAPATNQNGNNSSSPIAFASQKIPIELTCSKWKESFSDGRALGRMSHDRMVGLIERLTLTLRRNHVNENKSLS